MRLGFVDMIISSEHLTTTVRFRYVGLTCDPEEPKVEEPHMRGCDPQCRSQTGQPRSEGRISGIPASMEHPVTEPA